MREAVSIPKIFGTVPECPQWVVSRPSAFDPLRTLAQRRSHRPMLDFIWHLRGSVRLDGVCPDERVLDGVERLLDRERKDVSERGADYLAFDDPLWRTGGPNWLAMVIYDRGRFWIESSLDGKRLCYDLRSLHGMVFCLVAAFMAFFLALPVKAFQEV